MALHDRYDSISISEKINDCKVATSDAVVATNVL